MRIFSFMDAEVVTTSRVSITASLGNARSIWLGALISVLIFTGGCDRKGDAKGGSGTSSNAGNAEQLDPVASFRGFVARYRTALSDRLAAEKAWDDEALPTTSKRDVLFTGLRQFDVTRTESLVSPYNAVLSADLHLGTVTDGKPEFMEFSSPVTFRFGYRDGSWMLYSASISLFVDDEHSFGNTYEILEGDSQLFRILRARLLDAGSSANQP